MDLCMCCAVLSRSVVSESLWHHGLLPMWPHGLLLPIRLLYLWWFSRQENWSGLPCPPPGDLLNPGIEPRSPTLQVDSLPCEPPGKPKNTGVGSLSLLQRNFPTQESIELGSPALQADFLPVELPRKPRFIYILPQKKKEREGGRTDGWMNRWMDLQNLTQHGGLNHASWFFMLCLHRNYTSMPFPL